MRNTTTEIVIEDETTIVDCQTCSTATKKCTHRNLGRIPTELLKYESDKLLEQSGNIWTMLLYPKSGKRYTYILSIKKETD